MATAALTVLEPKSLVRPTHWSKEVENAYRFQLAGYRDELEYKRIRQVAEIDIWPDSGFVKKLQRRKDGCFYYFDKLRECPDKEINKCTDQLLILIEKMVTSEYSFCYEPYRRVPMNSATTQKDSKEYNSIGSHSTYSSWSRSIKPTITTKYIDGTTIHGQHDSPYNTKDSFPKSKGRQKPFHSSNKKDARDAYISLLPVEIATVRTEKPSSLPELISKSANSRNKRSSRTTILDDDSQSKFYAPYATINVNGGWVRRYKSINESQVLSDFLRDRSYENKISIKKRPYQQLFVSSSSSSLNKRRREKC